MAPPYHLRPQKDVDRFLLIEILRKLQERISLKGYTYYGFGGPFLQDLRLINLYFPTVRLVSFEQDREVYKRQKFHAFTRDITLKKMKFKDFIGTYKGGKKEIFWLDYTGLSYRDIDEFMTVIQKAGDNSIIKITLRAKRPSLKRDDEKYNRKVIEDFRSEFGRVLPSFDVEEHLRRDHKFRILLCDIVRIASEKILPLNGPMVFKILNISHYAEPTPILTATGIKCEKEMSGSYDDLFKDCNFANLKWDAPFLINVPSLSIKERLHLERYLPADSGAGNVLANELNYHIGDNKATTIEQLEQYAFFYRYFPLFAKVSI